MATRQCSAFCLDEGDCPTNQNCTANRSVSLGGATFPGQQVCTGDNSLPLLACTTNADCAARNQACDAIGAVDLGVGLVSTTVCGTRTDGPGELGAACDERITENVDCASGLCDDPQRGQCIALCDGDADCSLGLICTDAPLGNFTTGGVSRPLAGRFCAEPCTTMSGCGFALGDPDSRICKRRCDDVDTRFELVCGPPIGTLDPGTVLAAGQDAGDCRSGLSAGSSPSVCSQPCVADADCPATMACGNPSTTTCGGNTAAFKICRPR
ncbi:MAG: hypothetical protein FJ137_22305 [Deltaproteobacteria bacterium]|nr:hypothetical protein [Deltaproteobacteria bacterium]